MTSKDIAKALTALEWASLSDVERRLYFSRMAALSDEKSLVSYNLEKGREEGIEKSSGTALKKFQKHLVFSHPQWKHKYCDYSAIIVAHQRMASDTFESVAVISSSENSSVPS